MSTLGKCLSIDNINPCIKTMEYAVRGPLVIRAAAIEKELEQGVKKPFNEVIRANIGDCHAMGQIPITFIRQVLGLCVYEKLFDDPTIPSDAKQRARDILNGCKGGSLGSYSDSTGIEVIRRHCAEYIHKRDGIPSNADDIILSAGASGSIKAILALLRCDIDGKRPGVMVPIPQYPLYSATIAEFDMQQIGYYLDESNNWGLDIAELQRSIDEAKKNSYPRAIVIINPGNPTGQVLTKENIEAVIKFAHKENLFIFADEVYQDNIYAPDSKFFSFKKVLTEMGEPYSKMAMGSFMSCSKGYMGECGIRGGYCELINVCPEVRAALNKSISAQLCPTTVGQACIDCVVNPPTPFEPSYDLFMKEKGEVLQSLKERALLVVSTFNSIEGLSCNPAQGAMYCIEVIRRHCAEYIHKRDGIPSNADDIILSAGASGSIKAILALLRCDIVWKKTRCNGYMGECGIRGGYCELINVCPEVRAALNKSISAQLCPTTVGQACIDCVVNPPYSI
ncbi:hypothetical protein PVAND_014222 [Polypedilum vanderplanki]|uniref:alanine transaminase n=1 Tax=Polypedilum vanderplanki TaxID=319348 RepID=A0A9J6CTJ8_POLVA|nr:hypothetical protein PVAND_014222 [Polypedilum vanderplanki]